MSDLDLLPIGVLRLDEDFKVLSASPKFFEMFRCNEKSILEKPFEALFGPRERKSLTRLDQAISSYSGGLIDLKLAVMVFDENIFHCRLKLQKIEKEWIIFLADVLKDDDFLHQLTVNEEIWASLMNESADAIAVLGHDHHLKRFNSAFSKIMKFKSDHGVLLNDEALLDKDLTRFSCDNIFSELFQYLSNSELSQQKNFKQTVGLDETILDIQAYPLHVPVKGFSGTCIVLRDITAQHQNEKLRLKNAHFTGMTEVATGIIHNIGNIINGVNIGFEIIRQSMRTSQLSGLQKASEMLQSNQERLVDFITHDPKGRQLIDFVIQVTDALTAEATFRDQELTSVLEKLNIIKEVIRSQQDYAKGAGLVEKIDIQKVIEESVQIQKASFKRHGIDIRIQLQDAGFVFLQRNKLVHILINLMTNAKEALQDIHDREKLITLEVGKTKENFPYIRVSDNGPGIDSKNIDKIFAHGFTTKPSGHGFGLHFCANAMTEMGGQLFAESKGIGMGAAFTLVWKDQ